MINEPEMRAELAKLSSEAIAQILDALHDLTGMCVERPAMSLLWERHGVEANEWPSSMARLPTVADIDDERSHHMLVAYCGAPGGELHQPVRSLAWKWASGGRKPRVFMGWQCSCGRVTGAETPESNRLVLKWRQVNPTATVWPVVVRDGIWHYRICKHSPTADNAYHAPRDRYDAWGSYCLCAGSLTENGDKYLPVL
jgi:hypothetical protein